MRTKPILAFVVGGLAVLGVIALAGAGGDLADVYAGQPQKKLFDDRWYYQPQGGDYASWMTLTTSDFWYECGTSAADCESRWGAPAQDAVDDWNSQATTVDFAQAGTQTLDNDMNIFFQDDLLGDPQLLGFATWYDQDGFECFSCEYYYAEVYASDTGHIDYYDTYEERQGTVAHEVGHTLSLRHESTNDDESVLYDCGEDDTGAIPYSIMSYNCIDPVDIGGLGLYEVEPWDVCGVNHAYFDPTIGNAGCEGGGPTDTPERGQYVWADTDCGGAFNIGDAINIARKQVNLSVNQQPGCPTLGSTVVVNGVSRVWVDTDCGGAFNIGDAINVARKQVNLPINQQLGCPLLGSIVNVGGGGTPTATAEPTPTDDPSLYDCNDLVPAVPIPDDDLFGVDLTVEFFDFYYITDLTVCVNILHGYIGDLVITLTHEDTGTSVVLVDQVGDPIGSCEGNGYFYVYLTDDASAGLDDGCDNLIGVFAPHNPLDEFFGELVSGTWTLNVADVEPGDTGQLLGTYIAWEGDSP